MAGKILNREELVEQAYFFRVLRERIQDGTPIQEVMEGVREEVLTTTRLPLAIDFLLGELRLRGLVGEAMSKLGHYFTSFQAFIMTCTETSSAKLDFSIALKILEKQAAFQADYPESYAGLFVYQFECLARNRLGYDHGMVGIANDPAYPEVWKKWITKVRFELGTVEFADLIYVRSEQAVEDYRRQEKDPTLQASQPVLFNSQAGRIARANLGKDPLYMFAALQRQLGYPVVPRPRAQAASFVLPPAVESRLQRIEGRIALLEQEQRGGIDLSQFYQPPTDVSDEL